jgi:D-inositol-3-phosphate glycosyltransferase
MKIAILCNSESWGGLEINLCKLAGWLRERNHDVTFIVNPSYKLYREVMKTGVKLLPLHARHGKIAVRAFAGLAGLLKKKSFEAVIIGRSDTIYAAAVWKIMGAKNVKAIYLQQMEIGISKKDILHTFLYKYLDAWIAPLKILQEQVLNRTRLKSEKTRIIPLCIRTEDFLNTEIKTDARKKLGVPAHEKMIGIIGRLDPLKGHETFLKALSLVIKKGYNVNGLIAGIKDEDKDSPYMQHLEKMILELGLSGRIFFKPFTSGTAPVFAALDIFAMCSLAETFGMVTIEALACGIPVVGSDSLGTKEILQSGKYGLMAEPGNPGSFAGQFEKLLQDPQLALSLSVTGKEYVRQNFDYTVQCVLIEKLVAELKVKN